MPLVQELEQQRIDAAVEAFEEKTDVELVVAIAPQSGYYPQASYLLAAFFAFLALTTYVFAPMVFYDDLAYMAILLAALVGYILGGRFAALQRLLSPKFDMQEQVELRAYYSFAKYGLHHTQNETALLIYISDFERIVYLVADRGVEQALAQEELTKLQTALGQMWKKEKPVDALLAAIEEFALLCAEKLPASETNSDELGNIIRKDAASSFVYRGFGLKRFLYRFKNKEQR